MKHGQSSKSKRPTIADVARVAGLSKTTVSKVMNLPPEQLDVPEVTRQRVLEAARQLDYHASWRARALRGGKTHTLALVQRRAVPGFSELWDRMMARLTEVCGGQGYHLQLVSVPPDDDDWRQMLQEQRFDGCFIFQELTGLMSQALGEAGLPAVLVNARDEAYASVEPDDRSGAWLLTRHLLELGHRRIAFLSAPAPDVDPRHYSVANRIEGYLHAMSEAGLASLAMTLTADPFEVAEQLASLTNPLTAIVTYNERVAIPLLHACWSKGVRVPADVSVATFNDVMATRHSIPPLTTVDVPVGAIAERAAGMLLRQVQGGNLVAQQGSRAERLVLPEQLIVRESTGAPRQG